MLFLRPMTVARSATGRARRARLARACARSLRDAPPPRRTRRRSFARTRVALEEGRADDAYRLLSDDARRGTSLEAFRRMVKDDPEQVREIGKSSSARRLHPVVTAKVVAPDGQELDLVLEKGAWRIDAAAIDLYAQDTPRHAVQGFVRRSSESATTSSSATSRTAHKEGIDAAEAEGRAGRGRARTRWSRCSRRSSRRSPGSKFEETGDHATFAYGAGTMQLVRRARALED